MTPPRHLDFKLNDKMKMAIDRAVQDVEALKAEHQITVLQYSGYGKEVIKNFNCSPDVRLSFFRAQLVAVSVSQIEWFYHRAGPSWLCS